MQSIFDNIKISKAYEKVCESTVTDNSIIASLEDEISRGEYYTTYRAMENIDGVGLVPPMAELSDEGYNHPAHVGDWVKPDFDLMDKIGKSGKNKGKVPIKYPVVDEITGKKKVQTTWVAPNAYIHSSQIPFNDQFTAAHNRPNLVIVRLLVPKSATTGEKSHPLDTDPPGFKKWHAGPVATQMKRLGSPERKVLLSNYAKIDKVLSASETMDVYDGIVGKLKDKLFIPYEVVSPSLRDEMKSRGYNIVTGRKYC